MAADTAPWQRVCDSADLVDGSDGVRFDLDRPGPSSAAFVVRHQGTAHGYLNRCAHVPVELDWLEGQFFDGDARYLMCATHGAVYDPASGACMGGPCAGRGLVRLDVCERDGAVWARAPVVAPTAPPR
ncbi:MAG: Rieske 2Fe-2S domain-containing protein [Burkholderiaceae bacterium]